MMPLVRVENTKPRKIAIAVAIACAILLVPPGCGMPKLREPPPPQSVPQSFSWSNQISDQATTLENTAQVGFAEFFEDPRLVSLIDQALIGNQNLNILSQNIAIANNEVMARRGAYLPFIAVGTSASLNKYSYYTLQGADNLENTIPGGGNFPTPLPDFMTAANLSWQIDIWRQLRNARDSAMFRYFGSVDGRNYVVTRLIADVAENYYHLMALDKRLENLNFTIALQEQSLEIAKARKAAARGTELAVQRFTAEVRKNQSEKLIINQEIIVVENQLNFLLGRFPQPVERDSAQFFDLNLHTLRLGVPSQLLQNRPDIREAERQLEAAGLDVRVARANFYPKMFITADVGWEAFNTRYLFVTPQSLIYSVAGDLIGPLINKAAIRAEYLSANARQIQAVFNYQRVVLNAFIEVVNRMAMVENYTKSVEIKKRQLAALETSVAVASNLFQNARVEYIDVLFAQRDMLDARMVLIDTKREQLFAIINTYQALGGGLAPNVIPLPALPGGPVMEPMPEPLPDAAPAPAPLPAPLKAPEPAKAPQPANAPEPVVAP